MNTAAIQTSWSKKSEGYWTRVFRAFRRNRSAMGGLAIVGVMGLVALGAPFIAGDVPVWVRKDNRTYWFPNLIIYRELAADNLYANFDRWEPGPYDAVIWPLLRMGPLRQNLEERLEAPSVRHWFGTDDRGRDVFSRVVWGARVSMSVGFISVGIAVAIGTVLGALAGYYGRWVDTVVLRLIEIWICVPSFFLVITVMAFLEPGIDKIMIVIGLTGWPAAARLVRGEMLKQREMDYAMAARASGLPDWRVMFRHLLPNAVGPVFVTATFGVAGAILTESALSFLGFGVPPPTASWGEILKQSQFYVDFAWWLVLFPGLAVFITVVGFNLVGDGLRDAMDPRLQGGDAR